MQSFCGTFVSGRIVHETYTIVWFAFLVLLYIFPYLFSFSFLLESICVEYTISWSCLKIYVLFWDVVRIFWLIPLCSNLFHI